MLGSGSQLGVVALNEHLGGLLDGLCADTTHFGGSLKNRQRTGERRWAAALKCGAVVEALVVECRKVEMIIFFASVYVIVER